jgi:hypothetical protein
LIPGFAFYRVPLRNQTFALNSHLQFGTKCLILNQTSGNIAMTASYIQPGVPKWVSKTHTNNGQTMAELIVYD